MTRLALLALGFCATVAGTTTADARDLFRFAQVEELAPPPQIRVAPQSATPYQAAQKARYRVVQKTPYQAAQRMPYQAAQKMPYQAAQKMPYQASQKGLYHKAQVAHRVRYVQHRPCKKTCCGCANAYQTTLAVYDPCSCCMIDVPVCLPGCCTGAPAAGGRVGLLGQGITNFAWCCGYEVRVVVSKHGDVTVHYYGA